MYPPISSQVLLVKIHNRHQLDKWSINILELINSGSSTWFNQQNLGITKWVSRTEEWVNDSWLANPILVKWNATQSEACWSPEVFLISPCRYPLVSSNMACWKMDHRDQWFSSWKPPFSSRISQLAMFDYQQVWDLLAHRFLGIGKIPNLWGRSKGDQWKSIQNLDFHLLN